MIGQTISHYKILEKLGEGGMGVVYKAHDTTLDRDVALKFLPPHVSGSEQDKSRFLQEAQAAAALSHPNICTIYGIEENEGRQFIVMQFVEGQMLQEKKQNLSLKQALEIGIQIADGLAAAHEKGVVHRDIKPENIMIRKDGSAQVMDFGLAKLRGASRLTKEGSTVGTAGYMSPEQVQGLDVDHRTDIFSLGVILYEMFTGQSPFKGVHETAIAYEIVNVDPPPMATVKADIDPEIDAIVLDCLAKDPADRYQSAAELARNLRRFKRESSRSRVTRTMTAQRFEKQSDQPTTAFPPLQRYRKYLWPALSGLMALSLIAMAWTSMNTTVVHRPVMRFSLDLPDDMLLGFNLSTLDISPDGKYIIYSGGLAGSLLYLRRTDDLVIRPLMGTAGALYPAFSPDGQWIAYEVNGILMKISVFGGAAQKLCDVHGQSRGLTWPSDNVILFGHVNRGILRISANGGEPEAVTALDTSTGEISHRFPYLLSDGNILIYTVKQNSIVSFDDALIVAQRLDTGERKVLVRGGSYGRYAPSGHLVYVRGSSILAVPFDPSGLSVQGEPVAIEAGGWLNRFSGDAFLAFSKTGALVFSPAEPPTFNNIELSWIDKSGTVRPLVDSARAFFAASISPDGQKLAVEIQAANDGIWIYHLQRKTTTRFTFAAGNSSYPIWSPDGKYVAYAAERGTATDIFRKPWDGSGAEERLTNGLSIWNVTSYAPDGKAIAFVQNGDIWILPLDGDRTPRPFLNTGASEATPKFSPDGDWMAFSSNESGRDEIYVVPYPSLSNKHQVSSRGGFNPLWSPDGKHLYYVSGSSLMAVQITGTAPFDYSAERKVITLPPSSDPVDISPDGQRFVLQISRLQAQAQSKLTVVLEWFDELRAKVGKGK